MSNKLNYVRGLAGSERASGEILGHPQHKDNKSPKSQWQVGLITIESHAREGASCSPGYCLIKIIIKVFAMPDA